MLLLALDTSSPAVTVALSGVAPEVRSQRTEVATNRHGELLAPLIDAVLTEATVAPCDLTAIGVGLGPGPFTGLRVGIMTAKAIGDALGIPVYGECSLDAIAAKLVGDKPFAVLSDARRKQVYWAKYSADGRRVAGPEINNPADLAADLRDEVAVIGGAGAVLYRDAFDGFKIVDDDPYPDAAQLAALVLSKASRREPSDDLTPLYLRRPDAVPPGAPKQVTPA